MRKRNKLPRQTTLKNAGEGLPTLLINIRGEPLTETVAVKLQPSLAKYLEEQGNTAELIRTFIIEGLQRTLDNPNIGACSACINLTERDGQPFCLWQCATFLPEDQKRLSELFSCEGFQRKKEAKK